MESCHNFSAFVGQGNTSGGFKPTIPSVPSQVTLSLTIFYIVIYFSLFSVVYVQLWLILYYNYKRFSFQTTFLFLCTLWSALRATLFSFYFKNTQAANELPMSLYWLLYCFPVCLQFFTLCLLNLYFAQVMFKAKPNYAAHPNRYIIPLRAACLLAGLVFLGMNISCAAIVHNQTFKEDPSPNLNLVRGIIVARVLINDVLFVVCAICLAYCFFKISKTTSANILLEAKGTTVCQATSVGILIVLLYSSRAIYNLLAISPLRCSQLSSFNFDWYNVSDQADLINLKEGISYIVFGIVLFVWELLPTGLTIFFFRVRKPETSMQSTNGNLVSSGHNSRVYFFDNPQRYDSDDDLTTASMRARVDAPYLTTSTPIHSSKNSYGTHARFVSGRLSVGNVGMVNGSRSPKSSPSRRSLKYPN
ncbi:G protein-coupled receptor 137Ba-like isoform X1 [Clavelina lepadiformis]|uniref:G protein-coupled receptor 137Ba-like isoform X1 n=1 Tax=Clavelina lepadiformis TaxID=159417 RepID=UPI00404362B2